MLKKLWRITKWVLLAVLIVLLVGSMIVAFNTFGWKTGWNDQVIQVGPNEEYIPGKTLWDWLDLLIIPAMLAFGAWWVNQISQQNEQTRADRENQIEREIAAERNQEAALQNYLDKMTELLLEKGLRESKSQDEVQIIARTRTITILRSLNTERKEIVFWFLEDLDLIQKQEDTAAIVSLLDANLSEVNMMGAHLEGANLSGANLVNADLTLAILDGATLSSANLKGAKFDGASLNRTMLPDAEYWTKGTDMSKFTNPDSDWNKAYNPSPTSDALVSENNEEQERK